MARPAAARPLIGFACLHASICLAGLHAAQAPDRGVSATATPAPVEIHAPNVASDSAKASDAIDAYLHSSSQRDAVWADAMESQVKAPYMYPEHLGRLLTAQNDTL